jgi:hypothetical protein
MVTYKITPLNPSQPPFTKGRRTISLLYQREAVKKSKTQSQDGGISEKM